VSLGARAALSLLAWVAGSVAFGEEPTVRLNGLVQAWGDLAIGGELRLDAPDVPANRYYNLRAEFREDGFVLRRAEVRVGGSVVPSVEFAVMLDPAIGTGSILQDAYVTLKPGRRWAFRAGQLKTLQTYEGLLSSAELLFIERAQASRVFGDTRDRGGTGSLTFGDPERLAATAWAGAFNGSGKSDDQNRWKDAVARVEVRRGPRHLFGVYGLRGRSDLADARVPLTFPGSRGPEPSAVVASADLTTNLGGFYVFQTGSWHASLEAVTGRWGRRQPALGPTPGPARREHLDQRFVGMTLTGAYHWRRYALAVRHDVFDANAGDRWYGPTNPYRDPAAGSGGDFSPRFHESTAGVTAALVPDVPHRALLRVNYVRRSRNVLQPRDGQGGPRGGDSLVGLVQVAF